MEENPVELKTAVDGLIILGFAYLGNGLCPVFYPQFSKNIMEVGFYGIDSQVCLCGYFFVGQASGQVLENFVFPGCKLGPLVS